MVRRSPHSFAALECSSRPAVSPELARVSDFSALRVTRPKTRPIVGSCQILRRHIDDISNSRRPSFLPRFRSLGEVSCVARLQLSSCFLNCSACTCSNSRFHDAARDCFEALERAPFERLHSPRKAPPGGAFLFLPSGVSDFGIFDRPNSTRPICRGLHSLTDALGSLPLRRQPTSHIRRRWRSRFPL
jgi:hypothetical protein